VTAPAEQLPASAPPRPRVPLSAVAALVLLGTWVMLALAAAWIAPYDPDQVDLFNILQAPSAAHWFGTDQVGRDVLSRVIHGARIDLLMCVLGVLPALIIGTTIGLVSGYYGGVIDAVFMRIYDITVAFPFFVLVLAIVGVLGPGLTNYFIALALVAWVTYARIVRAEVLVIRQSEYVLATRVLGYPTRAIIFRHVLPNALSPVATYSMTDAILVILAGASLGFLGMGAQPPTAEWGVMIADGQPFVQQAWWICLFPGLALISLGLGLAFLGDALGSFRRRVD
jgi:peptide/nickel transport system permease protein